MSLLLLASGMADWLKFTIQFFVHGSSAIVSGHKLDPIATILPTLPEKFMPINDPYPMIVILSLYLTDFPAKIRNSGFS